MLEILTKLKRAQLRSSKLIYYAQPVTSYVYFFKPSEAETMLAFNSSTLLLSSRHTLDLIIQRRVETEVS